MSSTKLGLAFLVLLSAAGCAAPSEDVAASAGAESAGDGACIDRMPSAVWAIAARLDLGVPTSASGEAGSTFFDFQSGVVRWSNETSRVTEVRVAPKGVSVDDATVLPLDVALAAATNVLGAYAGEDGAAGSRFYQFERGEVQWSNEAAKVSSVIRKDEQSLATAEDAPPAAAGGATMCLETMPAPVWNMAAHLELGPATKSDGASGSIYFTFADGSELRWVTSTSTISEAHLVSRRAHGEPVDVPLAVANAAADAALGAYVSHTEDGSSRRYVFQRGELSY